MERGSSRGRPPASSIRQEPKAKLVYQHPVARPSMQKPPLDPDVADTAPSDSVLTVYDEQHIITLSPPARRQRGRC
jgi:hypothetical protein